MVGVRGGLAGVGLGVRQEWLQLRGGDYASDSQEAWSELHRPADSSSRDWVELVVCQQPPRPPPCGLGPWKYPPLQTGFLGGHPLHLTPRVPGRASDALKKLFRS